jgi:hypothetical protein
MGSSKNRMVPDLRGGAAYVLVEDIEFRTEQPRSESRFRSAGCGRIYKLPNFSAFLIDLGLVMRLELLKGLEFLLRLILLPGVDIVLAEPVMRVRKVGVQLQRTGVLGQ